jgi:hypothetical protein
MRQDLLGALVPAKRQPASPPVLPAPSPAPTSTSFDIVKWYEDHPVQTAVAGLAGAAAVGVSYSRNQSVPWAIFHGVFGVPYLAYVGYEKLASSKGASSALVPT